ncbi:MAG: Do family serine endopeptidase [Devosiaceae bacterium]|nr:Do family serine endopeptidase [Devosiaceae bacterium MH13]
MQQILCGARVLVWALAALLSLGMAMTAPMARAQTIQGDDVPGALLDFFFERGPDIVDELRGQPRQPRQPSQPSQRGTVRQAPETLAQVQLSFAPVVDVAAPAVVNVYATRRERVRDPFSTMDPFFRRFFGEQMPRRPRERMASSLGSGVIVDPSGLIITNNHVIADAEEVQVALSDRSEYSAEILIRDERTDLAVLRVLDADGPLPAISIGASDDLAVGDIVLAIGNPFGVGQTVTQGIVSALARTQVGVTDFQFFIQTDAAINPGNSGGALVDLNGNLVGINTAIFSRSGGSNGIGFAIPTEMVAVVVNQAESGADFVSRPYLGATVQSMTPQIAQSLGMRRPRGVLISDLVPNGPSARAGLRRGDVVIAVDGSPINDPDAFAFRFSLGGIGGSAELELLRNGQRRFVTVALEAPPETTPRDTRTIEGRSPFAGLQVVNLSPAVAQQLGIDQSEGVMVTEVGQGSMANRLGFRPRDIIMQINGVRVDSTQTLETLAAARVRLWDVVFERGGRIRSATLRF